MTRLAVVCCNKSVLQIFDLSTNEKIQEIPMPNQPHEILVNRHTAYVSIPYRKGVYRYCEEAYEIVTVDLNENRIVDILDLRPNHSRPHGLFFGPQTGYLYVSCESNNGELLRMDTSNKLKILTVIPTHAHGPHWFTILPSEKKAYTANKELPFVSVLDLISNTFLRQIEAPYGSENIACSDDGHLVFLSTMFTSKDVCLVDTASDTIIYRITLCYPPSGFEVSLINPALIYVRHKNIINDKGIKATDDGYLQELNIDERKVGRKVRIGQHALNMVMTKDGKQGYISCGLSHRVDIVDLEKMELIGKIETGEFPHGLALLD